MKPLHRERRIIGPFNKVDSGVPSNFLVSTTATQYTINNKKKFKFNDFFNIYNVPITLFY